jgi:hypothetical protein
MARPLGPNAPCFLRGCNLRSQPSPSSDRGCGDSPKTRTTRQHCLSPRSPCSHSPLYHSSRSDSSLRRVPFQPFQLSRVDLLLSQDHRPFAAPRANTSIYSIIIVNVRLFEISTWLLSWLELSLSPIIGSRRDAAPGPMITSGDMGSLGMDLWIATGPDIATDQSPSIAARQVRSSNEGATVHVLNHAV